MVMCSGEEKYWKYYFDDVDTKTEENTECGDCACVSLTSLALMVLYMLSKGNIL